MGFLIESLLLQVAELRASDLHICEGGLPMIRIGGILRRLEDGLPAESGKLYSAQEAEVDYRGSGRGFSYAVSEQPGLFSDRAHKVYDLFAPILPEKQTGAPAAKCCWITSAAPVTGRLSGSMRTRSES